jgi:hypothetical protein
MSCLQILAGPLARQRIAEGGLRPEDIRAVPGAAGGPKGLVLHGLDRYLFGHWLAGPGPQLHLIGASIGAWRLACAAAPDAEAALASMAQQYVEEEYVPPAGERQSARNIGARYAQMIGRALGGREAGILAHPRRRLHLLAVRGRGLLARERRGLSHLGFALMAAGNALQRRWLGHWLERVVFSDPRAALPLQPPDLPTRHAPLTERNLLRVVLASGSIPFWFPAVRDIPDAPAGDYWDGGIGDYQLHWPWRQLRDAEGPPGLVLYPHYEDRLVPGWLDKALRHRHRIGPGADNLVLLAPAPDWVARLPEGRLPDRNDFRRLQHAPGRRRAAWRHAVAASTELAEAFDRWLRRGCPMDEVRPLEGG